MPDHDGEYVQRQCAACPWRDMAMMRKEFPEIVDHASTNPGGFVCHTRLGSCPGPIREAALSASSEQDDR